MTIAPRAVGALGLAIGIALGVAGAAGSAHATPSVYGTSALGELQGSRETPWWSGLKGFGAYATDFQISWDISFDAQTDLWTYDYTFTRFGDPDRGISHFALDLTDDCVHPDNQDDCVQNPTITSGPGGTSQSIGNIEFGDLDGIDGAVKFDIGSENIDEVTYSFLSNRAPVYWHFCIKDGGGPGHCKNPGSSGNYVGNKALMYSGYDDRKMYFVARPNGAPPPPNGNTLPEPGTLGVFLIGVAGLAATARRRRKQS